MNDVLANPVTQMLAVQIPISVLALVSVGASQTVVAVEAGETAIHPPMTRVMEAGEVTKVEEVVGAS